MFEFLKHRRREALWAVPFPEAWAAYLAAEVASYAALPPADREELHRHVQVLMAEKHFEGLEGFEVTETTRLVIAAQAAVLLLHRETGYFPKLQSIALFPNAFASTVHRRNSIGLIEESEEFRVGESWGHGAVLFSWPDVQADMVSFTGHNVIFHEFAHQLDQADGLSDGWPDDLETTQESAWHDAMARSYAAHRNAVEAGEDTFLRAYAAKSPAEFFAVLTEAFFELPHDLRNHHPEIYDVLSAYYRQDPTQWVPR